MTLSLADASRLARGEHGEPFAVLGPHAIEGEGLAIRAFVPGATAANVLRGRGRTSMERVHEAGVFEAVFPGVQRAFAYKLELELPHGKVVRDDPYRFGPVLTSFDLHLLAEGTHLDLDDKLGAQARAHERAPGVSFAVWAPTARRVSVVGNFNQWNGRAHPMRLREEAGVWELFVPGLGPGEVYKYEILGADGSVRTKADPVGRFMERRPDTASIVVSNKTRPWKDAAWVRRRARAQALDQPMSIYEVHAGSWRRGPVLEGEDEDPAGRFLTWGELADTLIPYAADMGFTHLELLPVTEHPLDASWGYQTVGYFAPTSRFGTPDDFRAFVDRAHAEGLGVLLDWAPAHFPKDAHGLAQFDGTFLYEHADPRKGQHPDWGTSIFNYGRPQVAQFLLSSALYWFEQFHVDGLRVDAVASMLYLDYSRKEGEWLPNRFGGRENLEAIEFLKRVNAQVHEKFPGALVFAEESTSWPGVSRPVHLGGLGFDLKWNLGWMHDTLEYLKQDPIYRRFHHAKMTFSLYYAWNENYLLPLSHDEVVHGKYSLLNKMSGDVPRKFANLRALYAFTENFVLPLSHDEVVHGKGSLIGKMPGDEWQRFANLRLLLGCMYAQPGKKLLFMGGEFGQWREWSEERALDWHLLDGELHKGLQAFVRELNRLHRAKPALHEIDFHWDGFEWIDYADVEQSVLAYARWSKKRASHVVIACNWTPVPRGGYRIGVPAKGTYREILNSDAREWGGGGAVNARPMHTEEIPWQGQAQSIALDLPPLGVTYLELVSKEGEPS